MYGTPDVGLHQERVLQWEALFPCHQTKGQSLPALEVFEDTWRLSKE